METETLRWLVEVADGDTVAAVAARHHISQPAVTRGLQRLSTQVGVPLTERDGRRLALSFAGELLVESGRRILADHDAALRAIAEADDPGRGVIRMGFLAPLGAWLVPELITAHRRRRPAVRFALRNDGASSILAALRAGELDLLLTQDAPDEAGVHFSPLLDEELALAVPTDHRLAGRRAVRMTELADESWVMQPEGHGLRGHVEELCAAAGFTPRRALESPDLATLFALIAAGSGIGLFAARPESFAAQVTRIPLRPATRRTVGLMLRRDATITAAAREFAAFADVWSGGPDSA